MSTSANYLGRQSGAPPPWAGLTYATGGRPRFLVPGGDALTKLREHWDALVAGPPSGEASNAITKAAALDWTQPTADAVTIGLLLDEDSNAHCGGIIALATDDVQYTADARTRCLWVISQFGIAEGTPWVERTIDWATSTTSGDEISPDHSRAIMREIACMADVSWSVLSTAERATVTTALAFQARQWYQGYVDVGIGEDSRRALSHRHTATAHFAAAALVLHGELAEADTWLAWCVQFFLNQFPSFGGSDGGWTEGPNYRTNSLWANEFIIAAQALEDYTGTDIISNAANPWFSNLAEEWLALTQPALLIRTGPGAKSGVCGTGDVAARSVLSHAQRLDGILQALFTQNGRGDWLCENAWAGQNGPLPDPLQQHGSYVSQFKLPFDGLIYDSYPAAAAPTDHLIYLEDIGAAGVHSDISSTDDNVSLSAFCRPWRYISRSHGNGHSGAIGVAAFGRQLVAPCHGITTSDASGGTALWLLQGETAAASCVRIADTDQPWSLFRRWSSVDALEQTTMTSGEASGIGYTMMDYPGPYRTEGLVITTCKRFAVLVWDGNEAIPYVIIGDFIQTPSSQTLERRFCTTKEPTLATSDRADWTENVVVLGTTGDAACHMRFCEVEDAFAKAEPYSGYDDYVTAAALGMERWQVRATLNAAVEHNVATVIVPYDDSLAEDPTGWTISGTDNGDGTYDVTVGSDTVVLDYSAGTAVLNPA